LSSDSKFLESAEQLLKPQPSPPPKLVKLTNSIIFRRLHVAFDLSSFHYEMRYLLSHFVLMCFAMLASSQALTESNLESNLHSAMISYAESSKEFQPMGSFTCTPGLTTTISISSVSAMFMSIPASAGAACTVVVNQGSAAGVTAIFNRFSLLPTDSVRIFGSFASTRGVVVTVSLLLPSGGNSQ